VQHDRRMATNAATGRRSWVDPKGWDPVRRRWTLPRIISRSLSTRLRGLSAAHTRSPTMTPVKAHEPKQLELLRRT